MRGPGNEPTLEDRASEVAGLMRTLANERRLLILCKLAECGEANVTALTETAGLSQSALSQHLALMREEGVVTFRRESQTLWYRIADPRITEVMAALHGIFCAPRGRTMKPRKGPAR